MPKSPAKARADAKFDKKAYDHFMVRLRRDAPINGDVLRKHAASRGESLNACLTRIITENARWEIMEAEYLASIKSQESQEP